MILDLHNVGTLFDTNVDPGTLNPYLIHFPLFSDAVLSV